LIKDKPQRSQIDKQLIINISWYFVFRFISLHNSVFLSVPQRSAVYSIRTQKRKGAREKSNSP
jgi:hypothetical protein